MDQKIISQGGIISGVILIFCAVLCLGLGIALFSVFPGNMWIWGAVLLCSSIMTGYGGVKQLRTSRRKLRTLDHTIEGVRKSASNNSDVGSTGSADEVLASWRFTSEEWKQFYSWELKKRKRSTWLESGLIFVGGSIFIYVSRREAVWPTAIAVSAAVSIIYGFAKYFFTMASLGPADNRTNEIIITRSAVLVNGKLNPFADETRRRGEVKIIEDCNPKVLQITYHWVVKSGETSDDLRIPIPKGKLGEAVRLVDKMM